MLKSLELLGFKSFADKTKFEFSPGITAVVGPNGSGKSNVVDGIKWILGDQSAKSLRGKEMTDVIFNGAQGRKPSNYAEATLTFDNTSGFLPTEAQEVQIGRRLWRNGDAEYLINQNTARLKDIRELFMGTGAGSAAYCIIEQGRVDQILQANPTSRRMIFEEAAGISRFKARKVEALRKLERVDQNLLRLTDIVDEVESRLNSLRSQASKAARFREISTELKKLWWGLAGDDYRHRSAALEELDAEIAECTARLETVHAEHQKLEEQLGGLDAKIAEVDDELRTVERASSSRRETLASHESTVRFQTARLKELDGELARLRKQRTVMSARATEVVLEMEHVRGQVEHFAKEFQERQEQLKNHIAEIKTLAQRIETERSEIDDKRETLLEQMREVSAAGTQVSGLNKQLQIAADSRTKLMARRETLENAIAGCRSECELRLSRLEDSGERVVRTGDRIQAIHNRRRQVLEERHEHLKALSDLREQRSGWKARKSVLEDLERRQQGLGVGVKEILQRAQTNPDPPWNQIQGSVADLLKVDLENAALLEVALGDRAQLIVLEEMEALIQYLKTGTYEISGRVGFIAHSAEGAPIWTTPLADDSAVVSEGQSSALGESANLDLTDQPGVSCRADQLVHSCEKLPDLPARLLADTWIVETLDVALELAQGKGRGRRFVTLQGELLESDGQLTVGSLRPETALVSRKSELRQLKYDLQNSEKTILREERRLEELSESLTEFDEALDAADSDLQELADRHAELKADYTGYEQELVRLMRDAEALDAEITRLTEEGERLTEELRTAEGHLTGAEEQVEALQNEISTLEFDIARSEHRLQTLEQMKSEEQLNLAKHEERLVGLQKAAERLERDQQTRIQQRDEAERRLASVVEKRREIVLHILNTNAILAELALEQEQIAANAVGFLREKESLRGRRAVLLKQESKLRAERRELNDRQHCVEMEARDIRHLLATLDEKIQEEYQVPLADVVQAGGSAYQDYLDANYPTWRDHIAQRLHDSDAQADTQSDAQADDLSSELPAIEDDSEPPSGDSSPAEPSAWEKTLEIPEFEDIREELENEVNRLRRKLKTMGNIDTESLSTLEEMESRFHHLKTQLADLTEAKRTLEDIVRRINAESKRLFVETFEQVRGHFQHLFRKAFGGGDGDIVLEDPQDVLECGIEIVARPPGKDLKSISLMSGGEKALTAFALLLALFKTRPSPYCLLDEVDAPLDEANVGRLGALLEEFKGNTQFIVITHKKPTMTIADVIYGVTMEQSGVSKRMSVRFEDVNEHGEFQTDGDPFSAAA